MPPTRPSQPPPEPASWADYARPSLAVDVAILTVVHADDAAQLALLVARRSTQVHRGQWDIPGAFVRDRERLDDAVRRVLRDKAGVSGLHPRQLGVLDDPERDDRGWVVSIAYTLAVPYRQLQASLGGEVRTAPVQVAGDTTDPSAVAVRLALPEGQGRLPFDHAVADLRQRYRQAPDPDGLLEPELFTLSQLHELHGLITGDAEHRDTFRRRVEPHLSQSGVQRLSVGRPAKLYRRVGGDASPGRGATP